jgi:hypothetical protein
MGRYKKYLTIMLIFSIHMIPFNLAFAGAAEKWEYDVIPDQSQRLQVKGHKVDQYGAAVNDYDYNTKIDPKTAANRTKMGTVGMGRLLKTSGWGLLGAAALQALLDSVGWIMDPESQSIWRNKKPNSGGSVNCSGGFQFQNNKNQQWFSCPLSAVEDWIAYANTTDRNATYKFLRFDSDPYTTDPVLYTVRYEHHTAPTLSKDMPNQRLTRKPDPNAQPQPKEYLTPEALADYANHTHPDYSNPELAPKLAPKYSPEIQTDLWKPSNSWEDTNSPTVQEVKKELEKAPPEPKTDPEVTPNPETGGFALPAFCSWAAPVCEFIKWVKEEPSNQDNELDIDKNTEQAPDTKINFSTQCPSKIPLVFSWNGGTLDFSFDFTIWCNAISTFVYPIVVTLGSLHALYIVTGVRQNG